MSLINYRERKMKSKFSRLLMTGKAATLPFLMSNAEAVQTWTPSLYTVITDKVTQVQLPVDRVVELNSLGSSPVYDGSATVCNVNGAIASKLGVVLTGLKDRDLVYVITSTNLGGNQSFHPNLKIGTQNLFIPKALTIGAGGSESVSATVAIDLSTLASQGYALTNGTKFYMQTIVFPAGALNWSQARISELDVVSVNTCSSFGPHGQIVY